MKRREFIAVLGGAAAWPVNARAQPSAMPVIGYLGSETPDLFVSRLRAFRQGLSETGYVEGRNVAIEYRWAQGHIDRFPALAADLTRQAVAVIAAAGTQAAAAAKAATTTIPIVFNSGTDPVENGLVASLNRPGGNLTGVSNLNVALEPKRLELMRELLPTTAGMAFLINPTNPRAEAIARDMQDAGRILKVRLHVVHASTEHDFETVFATMAELRAGALVINNDGLFLNRPEQLGALTARHAMPTIFQFREFAAAGGLMSYGGSISDPYRLVGIYAGRILKGEKPADLPVQQSTKVELVLNHKTAKALGLTVPLTLLGRADEVIE